MRPRRSERRGRRRCPRPGSPRVESLEGRRLLATFTVTDAGDLDASSQPVPGSLRQAILDANASPGPDTIAFNIPGAGVHTIAPAQSALPTITDPVTIDGYTQPGASPNTNGPGLGDNAAIEIELSGANFSFVFVSGLTITAGSSVVRGLAIDGFLGGITANTHGGDVIAGNFIGTDPTGAIVPAGGGTGVFIQNTTGNTVGGTSPGDRNVIVGATAIDLLSSTTANNLIAGNFIGIDATGTRALGGSSAIGVSGPGNTIGGTTPGARNVILGGISFSGAGTGCVVQGNFLGTDVTGTKSLGGGNAIFDGNGAGNETIGGSVPGAGNLIVGENGEPGIEIRTTGDVIQGNLIGTDVTGTKTLGSLGSGVGIEGGQNILVGGTTAGARNVIAGCQLRGIFVFGSTGLVVQGNYIGTDITGSVALGNSGGGSEGIFLDGTTGATIGGTTPGAGNVISGNAWGIDIGGSNNVVQGNFIGSDASGTRPLGNSLYGIDMSGSQNTIGGTAAGAGNVIIASGGPGIRLINGTGNSILGNSIYADAGLGIDLNGNGLVVPNDPGDTDSGPNDFQNYPVLTLATPFASSTIVQGTLNSTPKSSFLLEFFANAAPDASGYGEGQTFLGRKTVTTDASGNVSFTANLPVAVPSGRFITATATNAAGSTSGFSADRIAIGPDRFEPDDARDTAADLGPVRSQRVEAGLTIDHPGDEDWFALQRSPQDGVARGSVQVGYAVGQADLGLELYDAGGNKLDAAAGAFGGAQIDLSGLPAGTYYARVFAPGGGTSSSYTLTVTGPGDRFEPDDDPSAAANLGFVSGQRVESGLSILPTPDGPDVDFYKFATVLAGTAADSVRIDFDHTQGPLSLTLLSAAGVPLASASGDGDAEQIPLAGRPAGTYLVQVTGLGDATNPDYTLTVHAPAAPPDRFEPDDTFAAAHDLGVVQGQRVEAGLTIDAPNNDDWYRFQTTGPGSVSHSVRIDFKDVQGDLDLELYDAHDALLARSSTVNDSEQISLAGRPAGVYYVRVLGFAGAVNLAGYTLTISAPGPGTDRFDPNASFATAGDLGVIQAQHVEPDLPFNAPKQDDWFKFQITAAGLSGDLAEIDFDNAQGNLDLQLYDRADALLASSAGQGNREVVSLAGRPAGQYSLRVFSPSGGVNPGGYSLTINGPGAPIDRFEPNDSQSQASDLGIIEGLASYPDLSIHAADNDDWYRFQTTSAASGGRSVRIDFASLQGQLALELRDQAGNLLSRADTGHDFERVALDGLPAGTYLVRVAGVDGATSPGYALTIDAPGVAADRLEPNDDFPQATDLRTVAGTTGLDGLTITPGDRDLFKFTTVGPGAGTDAARLTFPGAGVLRLDLYDAGHALKSSAVGAAGAATIQLGGLPAGTYYLAVSGAAPTVAGRYALRLDTPTSAAATRDDWTIMVYMTASNLGQHAFDNINQMEQAATKLPGTVHIAVLLDQSSAPGLARFATGGDPAPWGDAGQALIVPDTDPGAIATPFDRSIGEQDTGNPATLAGFIGWAAARAPANHYALILWDHGNGVRGFNDDDGDGVAADSLTVPELAAALGQAAAAGVRLDLVGFDSCLMAMAEVGYALRPYAQQVVASEQDEPGAGYDYSTAFDPLVGDPGAGAAALATGLVQSYQNRYQDAPGSPDTLSATSAAGYDALAAALRSFTAAVASVADPASRSALAEALAADRDAVRDFGAERTGYRDLGLFLGDVARDPAIPAGVAASARAAQAALAALVVAQTDDRHGDTGLSIYLPEPDTDEAGNFVAQYRSDAAGFLAATGWQSLLDLLATTGPGREIQDVYEPNDGVTTAYPLNQVSGTSTVVDRAKVDPASDLDYYRFTIATAGGPNDGVTLSDDTRDEPVPGLLRLTLLDAAGAEIIHRDQATSGETITISLSGRAAGPYFALVQSINGATVPGYTLAFAAPIASSLDDPNRGHDQMATAEPLGTVSDVASRGNQVLEPGRDDWFAFATPKVPAAGGVQGRIKVHLKGGGPAVAQLLSADGATVKDVATGSGDLSLTYPINGAGDSYLLRVSPAAGTAAEQYDLTVDSRQAAQATDRTPPTLALPPDQSFAATDPGGAAVTFAPATATDDLDPHPTITYTAGGVAVGQGSRFPTGRTVVTATATDASGNVSTGTFTITVVPRLRSGDFNGDGKEDFAIYDQTASQYFILFNGAPGALTPQFGNPAHVNIPIAGDFNGDGKTDFAIYDQTASQFFILFSGAPGALTPQFGNPSHTNVPIGGDFNGDGKTDFAIYDQTQSQFFILFNGASGALTPQFGNPGHVNVPIAGDFNGDGKADFAVYDQTASQYFILFNGAAGALTPQFGNPAHVNAPIGSDYNGDGRADFAIYDQTTSQYFILFNGASGDLTPQFGNPAHVNVPIAGDYNGDGRADFAIYDQTASQYFILFNGAAGALTPQFGNPAHRNFPVGGGAAGPARVAAAEFSRGVVSQAGGPGATAISATAAAVATARAPVVPRLGAGAKAFEASPAGPRPRPAQDGGRRASTSTP
jgi:hypothetical protein